MKRVWNEVEQAREMKVGQCNGDHRSGKGEQKLV